jgi:hypothetical protein
MQRLGYMHRRVRSDWDPIREFPQDVERLLRVLEQAGFAASAEDAAAAYQDYSASLCAGWLQWDDSDDRLINVLLARLSPLAAAPD